MHYLGFDLETGGFDKKEHTILDAYFCIWDEDWNQIDELRLYMTDNEGKVNATEKALKVTGIDLEEHLKRPDLLTYDQAKEKLIEMLDKHKIPKKRTSYRFLGQNIIYFDIPFLQEQGLLTEEEMKKCGIGHNSIDSTVLVTWLKELDILPASIGSISSLIDYFELPKGKAHTSKDDVHMQKDIYIRLCNLMKKQQEANLMSQGQDNDLLKIVEL